MSAAIVNMAVVFGLVQLANKYQLDAPENTNILRIAYGSVQGISLLLVAFIYYRINKKNDQTKLIYSEPQSPFSQEEPKVIQTTNSDYDKSQAKQLVTQIAIGLAIIGVMHFKYGYLRPLLLQSVLGFRTLAAAPVVKVWLFGQETKGELLRPWKQANPLGAPQQEVTAKELKQKEKEEKKKKISNKKTD